MLESPDRLPSIPNDDFDSPTMVPSLPFNETLNTSSATSTADDPPLSACERSAGSATVWYRYTPSSNVVLNIDTYGSDYDTMLAVWTGTRETLLM
jgi:hypothetical protein